MSGEAVIRERDQPARGLNVPCLADRVLHLVRPAGADVDRVPVLFGRPPPRADRRGVERQAEQHALALRLHREAWLPGTPVLDVLLTNTPLRIEAQRVVVELGEQLDDRGRLRPSEVFVEGALGWAPG